MIGKWQGDWQGQWQGANGNPGAMYGTASISITATGTLTGGAVPPIVVDIGGGIDPRVRAFYAEQERIAAMIRRQNQAIVAMVLSLVISEGEE